MPSTPSAATATPPPQASHEASSPPISGECRQCLTFLHRALDQSGRPRLLLEALGVVPPSISRNHSNSSTANGNAVNNEISSDDEGSNKLYTATPDGRGILVQLSGTDAPPPIIEERVTLQKRLTRAASRIVGRSEADTRTDEGSLATPMLTTSPVERIDQVNQEETVARPKARTITIECMACGNETRAEANARAYVRGPNPLSIILCSNRLSSPSEISEVLIHELIHIYDVSRSMDLQQCRQLAYSEVRAARDAECHKSLTTFTRNICAKDKATAATKNMFPDQGRGCVCEVFDRAILDMSPLGPNGNVSSVKPCLNGGGMRSSNLGGSDDNTAPRPSER